MDLSRPVLLQWENFLPKSLGGISIFIEASMFILLHPGDA
jgi:hypothetical protein